MVDTAEDFCKSTDKRKSILEIFYVDSCYWIGGFGDEIDAILDF
jgi:hypothetical protein